MCWASRIVEIGVHLGCLRSLNFLKSVLLWRLGAGTAANAYICVGFFFFEQVFNHVRAWLLPFKTMLETAPGVPVSGESQKWLSAWLPGEYRPGLFFDGSCVRLHTAFPAREEVRLGAHINNLAISKRNRVTCRLVALTSRGKSSIMLSSPSWQKMMKSN